MGNQGAAEDARDEISQTESSERSSNATEMHERQTNNKKKNYTKFSTSSQIFFPSKTECKYNNLVLLGSGECGKTTICKLIRLLFSLSTSKTWSYELLAKWEHSVTQQAATTSTEGFAEYIQQQYKQLLKNVQESEISIEEEQPEESEEEQEEEEYTFAQRKRSPAEELKDELEYHKAMLLKNAEQNQANVDNYVRKQLGRIPSDLAPVELQRIIDEQYSAMPTLFDNVYYFDMARSFYDQVLSGMQWNHHLCYSYVKTTGIAQYRLNTLRIQDTAGQMCERKKWHYCFQQEERENYSGNRPGAVADTTATSNTLILYVINLGELESKCYEDCITLRRDDTLATFEKFLNDGFKTENQPFYLVFNKIDMLQRRCKQDLESALMLHTQPYLQLLKENKTKRQLCKGVLFMSAANQQYIFSNLNIMYDVLFTNSSPHLRDVESLLKRNNYQYYQHSFSSNSLPLHLFNKMLPQQKGNTIICEDNLPKAKGATSGGSQSKAGFFTDVTITCWRGS